MPDFAGDYQVQLVTSSQNTRNNSGGGGALSVLNPAAPNFNASSLSIANSQHQHQLIPPSSRAHLWHEISGKVVQQHQQLDRWN
jgi:hypothetical protein